MTTPVEQPAFQEHSLQEHYGIILAESNLSAA